MRIDAHQHFWAFDPTGYPWIEDSMIALQRDFLPPDLAPLLAAHGIDGSIAVQARQSEAETRWLLGLADAEPSILGVVGWVDLCDPQVEQRIEALRHPKLCGFRHLLQDEPDDRFMLRPGFRRGLRALQARGIPYDLLVFPRHLRHALTLLDELPELPVVLDHLAKPPVMAGGTGGWAEDIRRIASYENVTCKVSGMVTEADHRRWRPDDFTAYLDVVFDAFGPDRLMFGSDWPVCLLAASYDQVVELVTGYFCRLDPEDSARLFGGTAARVYGLSP